MSHSDLLGEDGGGGDDVEYLAVGFDECYKFVQLNSGLTSGNNITIISSRNF